MLQFTQIKSFHQWRNIHAEAASQTLFQPVPATDRIPGRASPRLDRTFAGLLLLVGPTQFDPVALGLSMAYRSSMHRRS